LSITAIAIPLILAGGADPGAYEHAQIAFNTMAICGLLLLITTLTRKDFWHARITEHADYIQSKGLYRRYPIIVKDGKMGIYDIAKRKCIISCKYDYIKWSQKGKILSVIDNGRKYYIDITGQELK